MLHTIYFVTYDHSLCPLLLSFGTPVIQQIKVELGLLFLLLLKATVHYTHTHQLSQHTHLYINPCYVPAAKELHLVFILVAVRKHNRIM